MNEPLVEYFQCLECKEVKDWSEMHNKTLCKNCWSRTELKFYSDRARRIWNTYYLNKKAGKILK